MPKKVESFEIWAEKYRPKTFEEIINQEHVVDRVRAFVKEKNIPHMLFAGPAGTGKCVERNTPILTKKGVVKAIDVRKEDLVASLSTEGRIVWRKVKNVVKRKDLVFKVKTKRGNEVKVTAEHPFLVLRNGLPAWVKAKEIKPGDYIATPKSIRLKFDPKQLDFKQLNNLWAKINGKVKLSVSYLYAGVKKQIVKLLLQNEKLKVKEICKLLKAKRKTVQWALSELARDAIVERTNRGTYKLKKKFIFTNTVPLSLLSNLKKVEYVALRSNEKFSCWIKLFADDGNFYEWLGYLLSDGRIEKSRISFFNKNKRLLKRFYNLTKQIFGIKPILDLKKNAIIIRKAGTIRIILQRLFEVYVGKKKSYNIVVPQHLYCKEKSIISRFIRAYFDGDGCFYRNCVEIYSNSRKILAGIKILLLRFGINSTIRRKAKSYRLVISGSENLKLFASEIGSLTKKIKPKGRDLKSANTVPFASYPAKYIMKKLNVKLKDIGRKSEIEYVFERGKASWLKVKKIYTKIIKLSRRKLLALFNLLKKLELISVSGKDEINEWIKQILEFLKSREVRKKVEKLSGIRSDRLAEYSEGKRKPSLTNFCRLLNALSMLELVPANFYKRFMLLQSLLELIKEFKELTGLSYSQIVSHSILPSTLAFEVRKGTLSLSSIRGYPQLANRMKLIIKSILYDQQLLNYLELLDFMIKAEIFWDKVEKIEEVGKREVVDFEISDSHNFIGGSGFFVLHNTTTALVIARSLYGETWKQNILELNASDARGIDVIRGRVKDFARTKAIGEIPFKLIILDEADALTNEAQQALRRTMEDFADITRFILICNFSSKIIDPIQSRCVVFRFKAMDESHVKEFINRIVKKEKLKIDQKGIRAIIEIAEGDLRKVSNLLQASAALTSKITEDVVYEVASLAKPTDIREMINYAMKGNFVKAREKLFDLLLKQGLAGEDIVRQIHREIYKLDIPEEKKIQLIEKVGEFEFRISEGGDPLVQLAALLAHFALVGKK